MDANVINKNCWISEKPSPVLKAWIFGSYSRGTHRPDSDIDIMVEFSPQTRIGLLYFRMIDDLQRLCGRKIDLVEKAMLDPHISVDVANEEILIYERAH